MTLEEIIKILNDEEIASLVGKFHGGKDALDLALSALRPVSREQVEKVWSPCNFCAGAKYITGTVTSVYPLSETRQHETLTEGDFDFCPVCGRPLTDEAVDIVMKRLEELHENIHND